MRVVPITGSNERDFRMMLPSTLPVAEGIRTQIGIINDEDVPVGAAVVDDTGENIFLEYVFILPEYRRQGLGKRFLLSLIKSRREWGGRFFIAEFPYSNEAGRSLFESCGFAMTNGGDIYHIWQKNVIKNNKARKQLSREMKGFCKSVKALSDQEESNLRKFLKQISFHDSIMDSKEFEPALSSCVINRSGGIKAVMLCTEEGDDIVVHLLGGQGENNLSILLTLKHLLICLLERDEKGKITENGRVVFQSVRPNLTEMAEKLFGGNIECDDFIVLAVTEI